MTFTVVEKSKKAKRNIIPGQQLRVSVFIFCALRSVYDEKGKKAKEKISSKQKLRAFCFVLCLVLPSTQYGFKGEANRFFSIFGTNGGTSKSKRGESQAQILNFRVCLRGKSREMLLSPFALQHASRILHCSKEGRSSCSLLRFHTRFISRRR